MTPRKNILFFNEIYRDGLGDLGHLIDIASPENLNNILPKKELHGNDVIYDPNYIILLDDATPSRVRFAIQSLLEAKMISNEGCPHDLNDDNGVYRYLDYVNKINQHLFFYAQGEIPDDMKDLGFAIRISTFQPDDRLKACVRNACAAVVVSCMGAIVKKNNILGLLAKAMGEDEFYNVEHHQFETVFIGEHNRGLKVMPLPCSKIHSMGFRDLGILLKPVSNYATRSEKLLKLENKSYLFTLLGLEERYYADIAVRVEGFLKKTLFVPGYFQTIDAAKKAILISALSVVMQDYESLVFHLDKFDNFSADELKMLAAQGYSTIIISRPTVKSDEKIDIANITGGKTIRLLLNYKLNNKDFLALYSIAQLFGGCSGDKTFEMALENDLLPIFKPARFTKISHILDLIENTSGENSRLYAYFVLLRDYFGFNQAAALPEIVKLIDKNLIEEWKDLIKSEIRKKYNVYDKLPDIMRQSIHAHAFFSSEISAIATELVKGKYQAAFDCIAQAFSKELDSLFSVMQWALDTDHPNVAGFIWYVFIKGNHTTYNAKCYSSVESKLNKLLDPRENFHFNIFREELEKQHLSVMAPTNSLVAKKKDIPCIAEKSVKTTNQNADLILRAKSDDKSIAQSSSSTSWCSFLSNCFKHKSHKPSAAPAENNPDMATKKRK